MRWDKWSRMRLAFILRFMNDGDAVLLGPMLVARAERNAERRGAEIVSRGDFDRAVQMLCYEYKMASIWA